jgi:hypothetical protein
VGQPLDLFHQTAGGGGQRLVQMQHAGDLGAAIHHRQLTKIPSAHGGDGV